MNDSICSTCVMDSTAKPFKRTGSGCNYCDTARALASRAQQSMSITETFRKLRESRTLDSKYDVVVGVSGGLDSSYLLHEACASDLRVLAVHMDNCWNSSAASANLSRLIEKSEVDLVSWVVDRETQLDFQRAFLSADVVDVDLLYDNALHAVCYRTARDFKVKTILGGANLASEGVEVPRNWAWFPFDGTNVRGIARNAGLHVGDYPIFSFSEYIRESLVYGIRWLSPLVNDERYKREAALKMLSALYDFKDYGDKHSENIFTKVYQMIILPEKFGIDKRKAHLSSLIVSGQLTRDEAMGVLEEPHYSDENSKQLDISFFCDRLEMSENEFRAYLSRPPKPHKAYGIDYVFAAYRKLLDFRRMAIVRAHA